MALEQVRKSDKSGVEIPRGTGARVRIAFFDGNAVARRGDLTDEEAEQLVEEYGLKEVEPRPSRAGERRLRIRGT